MVSLDLANECLVKKTGFDSAENEPCEVCPLSAYYYDYYTDLIIFCNFAKCSRNDLLNVVLDKQSYHTLVDRLCSQAARDQK